MQKKIRVMVFVQIMLDNHIPAYTKKLNKEFLSQKRA
jgi:hypothetical protein